MIWSFVLAGIGVFGLYLAGRGNRYGWMVGIGAQVLWAVYAISTDQWGFLVSCVAYAWVYSMPLYRSWREQRDWERKYEEDLVRLGHEDMRPPGGYSSFDNWLLALPRRIRRGN